MARGVITLHEVPPEIRSKNAAQARQQLHMMLSNPNLTEAQRKEVHKHLAWVARWEAAKVDDLVPPPKKALPQAPLPPRQPNHHVVEVTEVMKVLEKS